MVDYGTQLLSSAAIPQPWQFDVTADAYGAAGDGQVVIDGVMTEGSPDLSSESAQFATATEGMNIIVNGALGTGSALVTTVLSKTDDGHLVLAENASASVTGAAVLWWTNDTAAFQAAIDDAATYAEEHGYAQVFQPPPPGGVFYGISGPLVNTGNANSQLVLPDPSATSAQYVLELYAEAGPGRLPMWTMEYPQVAGAIVSNGVWDSQADYVDNYDTYGPSAVLGSTPCVPEDDADIDDLPAFANIFVIATNWNVVTPSSNNGYNYTGINLGGCGRGEMRYPAAQITTNYYVDSGANQFPSASTLQNGPSRGLILPLNGNNDHAIARSPMASGYAFGMQLGEHAYVENPKMVFNCFAFNLSGNDGAAGAHLIKILNGSCEGNPFVFWITGPGGSGVGFYIDADIDIEGVDANGLIQDSDSGAGLASLFGEIRCYGNYSNDIFPPPYPTTVKLISKGITVPGLISGYTGFSGAGSDVAVQNPYWRDVEVIFSGGDITAVGAGVTLGGSGGEPGTAPTMDATGLSGSGSILWPAGGWLSFTYTGSPTWNVQVP